MSNDRTYRIEIKHLVDEEGQGGGAGKTPAKATPKKEKGTNKSQEKKKEDGGGKIAKQIAIQYGKRFAMSAVSNWGDMTGDYQTQAGLQAGVEIAGYAAAIAANPVLGGVAAAVGIGSDIFSYVKENKTSERKARFARQRLGLREEMN